MVKLFIFRQTRVFRITCFLLFKSSLTANFLIIAKPERVTLSKLCKLQSLFFKSYLIYTITTPSQLALNIILGTWKNFCSLLQRLQLTFRFKVDFWKYSCWSYMTDIPTVNYCTKHFLQQELSPANHLNSLYLMPVIVLLTICLIFYQQMHHKGPCFFNFTMATFNYVNTVTR